VILSCAHEKSPLSSGRRAFARMDGAEWSAPDAEEAVGDHAGCCQAAHDGQDHLGRTARAALRAWPVVRPDQVDGNGGFAYVGRLFHGRKYSSRPKAWSEAGRILSPRCIVLESGRGRTKKYPHERAERALAASSLLSLGLSCSMRDSRCKMPRRMEVACNSEASGM